MSSVPLVAWTYFLLPLAAQAAPAVHAGRLAAVLAWLDEDIDLAEKSGLPGIAASRRADQACLRSAPPVATAVESHPDLLPPIARAEGNPVMKDFFRNLQKTVLTPDKRLPKGPEWGKGLTGEGWAFDAGKDGRPGHSRGGEDFTGAGIYGRLYLVSGRAPSTFALPAGNPASTHVTVLRDGVEISSSKIRP